MPRKTPSTKKIEAAARARFMKMANPEVTFEQHLEIERLEAGRQADLAAGTTQTYKAGLPTMTPCGGGDFETGIDPNEWQGAHGRLPPHKTSGGSTPFKTSFPFAAFTAGLFADTLFQVNLGDPYPKKGGAAHQSWVASGVDPIVGISMTAPGSKGAARVGNAVNMLGVDVLSKTFTVTPATKSIKFWFALVMQNPEKHPDYYQPFFWVRVTETATGNVILGAVDLGNGSDKAIADSKNPFFIEIPDHTIVIDPTQPPPTEKTVLVYRDWSCAQINLASHVDKQVTVEFVTADCGAEGHWAYAYVDNFCGSCAGSPTGDFNFDAGASSKCGVGKLCFDYSLPKFTGKGGSVMTGTLEATLDIIQNGKTAAQLTSPRLTGGTSYCFDIDPSAIAGLDMAAEGFDYAATGKFAIGETPLPPLSVGAAPDGVREGTNNDYQLSCPPAFSYAVKFVCGTQASCDCACTPVRPGSYATEINIYNHSGETAEIVKYVIPVVFGGAAVGREPRTVTARAEDSITLPPYSATMDDCCRLAELLLGAPAQGPMPLSIGYLEIVSPVELTVTAVYTATGPEGGPVSIEVDRIDAKTRGAPPPRPAPSGGGTSATHH